jgi:hypothetical protein
MLWGRALSDGRFYPIPPNWYTLDLVPRRFRDPVFYEWVAQVELNDSQPLRMELNQYEQLVLPEAGIGTAALAIGGRHIATPEPVQYSRRTAERPCTKFYPDCGLWNPALRHLVNPFSGNARLGLDPDSFMDRPREGWHAPVEICWRTSPRHFTNDGGRSG